MKLVLATAAFAALVAHADATKTHAMHGLGRSATMSPKGAAFTPKGQQFTHHTEEEKLARQARTHLNTKWHRGVHPSLLQVNPFDGGDDGLPTDVPCPNPPCDDPYWSPDDNPRDTATRVYENTKQGIEDEYMGSMLGGPSRQIIGAIENELVAQGIRNEYIYTPSKLQLSIMATMSYLENCQSRWGSSGIGAYGDATSVGNSGSDPLPGGQYVNFLGSDHGCQNTGINAASQEYYCVDAWSQQIGGAHQGSAGHLYKSGDGSYNTYHSDQYRNKYNDANDNTCVVAVRGTDDCFHYGPGEIDCDADKDNWDYYGNILLPNISNFSNNKIHRGFWDYYTDQLVDEYAASWGSSESDCKRWMYTGHSLGGVLAILLSLDGINSCNKGDVFTIGSIPFVYNTQTKANHGGLRVFHEQDFAAQMKNCYEKESVCVSCWEHHGFHQVTPAIQISCKDFTLNNECNGNANWKITDKTGSPNTKYTHCWGNGPSEWKPVPFWAECTAEHHGHKEVYSYFAVTREHFWSTGLNYESSWVSGFECGKGNTRILPGPTYTQWLATYNGMRGETNLECPECCVLGSPVSFDPERWWADPMGSGAAMVADVAQWGQDTGELIVGAIGGPPGPGNNDAGPSGPGKNVEGSSWDMLQTGEKSPDPVTERYRNCRDCNTYTGGALCTNSANADEQNGWSPVTVGF